MEGLPEGTTVYADKGYDSAENRQHLEEHQLQDGIMRKACRNRSFGTLHRKFRYARSTYFGLIKVSAQSHLKAMCLNLLKAANRLSAPAAA
ncbi:IS1106 transposase (fragment) [Neisseria meningitidis]